MRIHDTYMIPPGGRLPSLGSLIGSRVSTEVFTAVNDAGYKSFFGSEFDDRRNEFFMRYVNPVDQLSLDLSRTVNALINPDQFRILESIEDFQHIPPCMEIAIATFAPVRLAIQEGRMEGFGYDPDTLPEDAFGRMIDNFSCSDVMAASDDQGYYPISATIHSDDPELDDDRLHAIERTREFIANKILRDTDRDPTAIDLPRG